MRVMQYLWVMQYLRAMPPMRLMQYLWAMPPMRLMQYLWAVQLLRVFLLPMLRRSGGMRAFHLPMLRRSLRQHMGLPRLWPRQEQMWLQSLGECRLQLLRPHRRPVFRMLKRQYFDTMRGSFPLLCVAQEMTALQSVLSSEGKNRVYQHADARHGARQTVLIISSLFP